jgi:hypothetical protein
VFLGLEYSAVVLSVHQKAGFLTVAVPHYTERFSRLHWPSSVAVLLQILLMVHPGCIVGKHVVLAMASYAQLSPC